MTMQLTFLGTGASEGYPAPFCRCERCQEARRRGGRNLRLRACLLVNDDLLVDYNDVIASCALYGVELSAIQTLVVTHSHADHWQPDEIFIRAEPFRLTPVPELAIYGPKDAIAMLGQGAADSFRSPERACYQAHVVAPGDVWQAGRYTLRAFHATHGTEDPLLYSIDDGQRRLLYSTDTGLYSPETWALIRQGQYDVVVMDETMGTVPTKVGAGHMGLDAVIAYRQAFEKEGLLKPGARFIAHHFSHGANPCHEELVQALNPYGIDVAFDGWRLTI